MNTEFHAGDFIRYIPKNELGLVKEVTSTGLRCWYHLGGTSAMTPYDMVEHISINEAVNATFSNNYAKESLFERFVRLCNNEDTSDLIDTTDISRATHEFMYNHKTSSDAVIHNIAEEMFEKLGFYKKSELDVYYIDYQSDNPPANITFYQNTRTYSVEDGDDTAIPVYKELHEAITQQMKELGWL